MAFATVLHPSALVRKYLKHLQKCSHFNPLVFANGRSKPEKLTVMTLTDSRIRNAKLKAQAYKLSDGGGMYLLVTPNGSRYWRLDYRFGGKRRERMIPIC